MIRPRDAQRTAGTLGLEIATHWAGEVWKAERAYYGARVRAPKVGNGAGHRRAVSYGGYIALPKWSRNCWVILHELAHELTPDSYPSHGRRFVGTLIGLASRNAGHDTELLLNAADAAGVKYSEEWVGVIPDPALNQKVRLELPGNLVELAVKVNARYGSGYSYRQVQGAALQLISRGFARWRGQQLIRIKKA